MLRNGLAFHLKCKTMQRIHPLTVTYHVYLSFYCDYYKRSAPRSFFPCLLHTTLNKSSSTSLYDLHNGSPHFHHTQYIGSFYGFIMTGCLDSIHTVLNKLTEPVRTLKVVLYLSSLVNTLDRKHQIHQKWRQLNTTKSCNGINPKHASGFQNFLRFKSHISVAVSLNTLSHIVHSCSFW